jgi:hypothetical protein
MDLRAELEAFKRNIKLHEYAASIGYAIDSGDSSQREIVMRSGADKISVRRDTDGHYVYYSFRNHSDNGTILDFVQKRHGHNLGETRKVLRIWLGREFQKPLPVFEHLQQAPRANRAKVRAEFAAMKDIRWHDYLEKDRALPRHVLTSGRFKGRVRVDARSNAIFPHFDNGALCGFEKRNRTFKGFSTDGEKGLWLSNQLPEDNRLVIGESAIDCISYHVLFGDDRTRYSSIAGGLNPVQPELIRNECAALPRFSEVICITHADPDGQRYEEVIRECASISGVDPLIVRSHRPEVVKDWNDHLRAHSFPAVFESPGV